MSVDRNDSLPFIWHVQRNVRKSTDPGLSIHIPPLDKTMYFRVIPLCGQVVRSISVKLYLSKSTFETS